jgi:hypothetical protein
MVDYLPGSSTPVAGDLSPSVTGAAAFGTGRKNGLCPAQNRPAIAHRQGGAPVIAGQQQACEGMAEMDLEGRASLPSFRASARRRARIHPEHSVKGLIAPL